MNSEMGQAWFRIAMFFTVTSGVLVLVEPRESAEFVISVAGFVIGLVFTAVVVFMVKRSSH